jgi:uncharacterized protein YceK
MKKLILLTIICTLISGCGLFRKKTKQVDISKSEQTSDVQSNVELDYSDKSKTAEVNTSLTSEFVVNGYKVKARGVKFNSDGSFTADEAEIDGHALAEKSRKDSIARFVDSNIRYGEIAEERVKTKDKNFDKDVATQSEPSGKAFVYGAIAVLIVVLGICFSIRKRY